MSLLDGHWEYKFILLSKNLVILYSVMLTYTDAV